MIFIRDRSGSDRATVAVDVSVFPRVDARPWTSNVASELAAAKECPAAAVSGCRVSREVRGSILLTTLDEETLAVLCCADGVDFGAEIRVVADEGVLAAIMVREARLLLLPRVEDLWAGAEGGAVRMLLADAASTVLLTGWEATALLL
jgi:hypothetical protein